MAGTAGPLHHLFDGTEVIDGGDRFGIHLLHRGREGDVGTGGSGCGAVGFEGARVFGKVLLVVELDGVDEDADHYQVVLLPCAADKREVAFVQGTHGGHQAYGAVGLLGFVDCGGEGRSGCEGLHGYKG